MPPPNDQNYTVIGHRNNEPPEVPVVVYSGVSPINGKPYNVTVVDVEPKIDKVPGINDAIRSALGNPNLDVSQTPIRNTIENYFQNKSDAPSPSYDSVKKVLDTLKSANKDYQEVLGRKPDPNGLNHYLNEALNGTSERQIRLEMAQSPEGAAALSKVIEQVQNRPAIPGDHPWLQENQQALADGSSLEKSRRGLIDYGGEDGVINDACKKMHGRDASQKDLDWARDQLRSGLSMKDYIWNDSHNAESTQKIKNYYKDYAGVDAPTNGQLSYYQDKLGQQEGLGSVRDKLIDGTEVGAAIGKAFERVHGRPAGQGDIDHGRGDMHAGLTLKQYTWNEAHGAEAAQQIKNYYKDYAGIDAPTNGQLSYYQDKLGQQNDSGDTKRDVINGSEVQAAIDKAYVDEHNRHAGQADFDYARSVMNAGVSLAQYRAAEVRGQDVTNTLTRGWEAAMGPNAGAVTAQPWYNTVVADIETGVETTGSILAKIGNFGQVLSSPAGKAAIALAATVAAPEVVVPAAIAAVVVTALWPTTTGTGDTLSSKTLQTEMVSQSIRSAVVRRVSPFDEAVTTSLGSGDNKGDRLEVHHAVAANLDSCAAARTILDKWKIGINNVANASIIPRSYHMGDDVHGGLGAQERYGAQTDAVMRKANDAAQQIYTAGSETAEAWDAARNSVLNAVRNYADSITAASGDSRAQTLQTILRTADRAVQN